jgi:hypothetical protein
MNARGSIIVSTSEFMDVTVDVVVVMIVVVVVFSVVHVGIDEA